MLWMLLSRLQIVLNVLQGSSTTAVGKRGIRSWCTPERLPGILLTLLVELAPPVRAGLQAQLQ